MDKNRDGVVTLDEFILSCQEVELIFQSIYTQLHPFQTYYLLKKYKKSEFVVIGFITSQ